MKTIKLKIYKFSELSKEAQEKAIQEHADNEQFQLLSWDMQDKLNELLEDNKIDGEGTVQYSLGHCQGDGAMFHGNFFWNGHSINIKQSGRYSHSNSKEIDIVDSSKNDAPDADEEIYKEFEELYQTICKQLEEFGYARIEDALDEGNIRLYLEDEANGNEYLEDGSISNF